MENVYNGIVENRKAEISNLQDGLQSQLDSVKEQTNA
jgi:hypothetical protein